MNSRMTIVVRLVLPVVCFAAGTGVWAEDQRKPAVRVPMIGMSQAELTIWNDPAFKRQFAESYIAATEIEPEIKDDERKPMLKVMGLLKPDDAEEKLRTPDKKEAQLIKEGRFGEAREIRRQKDADADRMREQKIAEAVEMLEALQSDEASAIVDFMLGNIHFQAERYDEAADAYGKAVRKFKTFRRAWRNLGLIHLRQEKFQRAIGPMTKVIALGGGDSQTYGLLGYAYSREDNSLAAESAYRMAILLDPEKVNWKMGLIQALFKQQRFADVVALCRLLLHEDADNTKLWLIQANAYIGLQRPLNAAENYEVVDRLGGSTVASLNNLGDIYINEDIYDLAVRSYVRALRKDEKARPDRAIRAAKALAARAAYTEMKELLDGIEKLRGDELADGERKDLLKLRARVAVAEGAGDEEARILEQIVKIDPLDGEALILLGQHSTRKWRQYKADAATARADENRKQEAEALARKADESFAKAQFYYERAESLEDHEADALVRHAQLRVEAGKYSQAMPLLRRAQTLKHRDNVQKYLEQVERVAKSR